MLAQNRDEVVDTSYFSEIFHAEEGRYNWVYEEMWTYYRKKFPSWSITDIQRHWSQSRVQLLEAHCSEQSEITKQGEQLGLTTVRFGLRHGDLSTFGGRCKLCDLLWIVRPDIWVAPKCSPWCKWNRLNAQKSLQLAKRIEADCQDENVHLLLCDALFRTQDWRGNRFHFHIEQPQGSELVRQKEMDNIVRHTMRVICDTCSAGALRHPNSQNFIRKRIQIWTTSKILWRKLERCQCVGCHHHDQIAGSCVVKGFGRIPLSKCTELYTAVFGRRIGRAIQCSSQIQEQVLGYRSVFALAAEVESDAPEPKRRRLAGKFHPEHLYIDQPSEEASAPSSAGSSVPADTSSSLDQKHQIQQILDMAEKSAPRVGKSLIREGPMFNAVQALYPDKEIRVLDVSRGINCMRTLSEGPRFKTLPPHTQQRIRKIHQNLGHPDIRVLQMALRRNGWSEEEVKASGDFVCPACVEQQLPKVARPSKLKVPADFNDHLTCLKEKCMVSTTLWTLPQISM